MGNKNEPRKLLTSFKRRQVSGSLSMINRPQLERIPRFMRKCPKPSSGGILSFPSPRSVRGQILQIKRSFVDDSFDDYVVCCWPIRIQSFKLHKYASYLDIPKQCGGMITIRRTIYIYMIWRNKYIYIYKYIHHDMEKLVPTCIYIYIII